MISITKFIVYTITIIIESNWNQTSAEKVIKKHDKFSLDFVFSERW